MDKKTRPIHMMSTRDPPQNRTHTDYKLRNKKKKKIFHANGNKKKTGVAILISDKIDFKTKNIKRHTHQ